MFDRVNTQNKHAYVHTRTSRFYNSIGQQPLSAGCSEYRMHRVCATCHHSQVQCSICLMGPTHRNRHTSMPDRCNSGCTVTCLLPSPGFVLFLAAQGLCNMLCCHSQVQAPWYVSDRINTRTSMHIYSTLFCCSDCAVAAASYPDYCCTGFVQQVVESGYRPARSFRPTEHIQPGTLMSDSILVTYWATCLAIYSYLLLSAGCCVATACRVCAACPQPGTGCKACLTASTHANKQAYVHYHVVQKLCKAN
jgi:hypothetical protein